ncbi:MAG TPA: response regulator transcription factor [Anaerohalosphaeraceae bacterium]|nr:response regulator transcription factor [Phycisphaerae bacterium]HOK96487.1 response regulator transcription factor [Anaerohalosphaeraceae bacterium]HOL32091.1 response regulator transcription factor [Anaerohalosphaeraceae bacterium]HOM75511.1 response regulator transcription factor [Anaerohalosphaeraceae bacterium]HPC64914.1 response regulator transcription factor [Anaerohalosphaeraceae bacterium]
MNAKVLVVDDQRDLLELLSIALSQEGYIVRTAASGAEALSMIAAEPPDLILLDIVLGDISGIKLTNRLKNDSKTARIPIILLTAKDSETDIIVGLSVGADDYITKPFSTKVLLARMDAVLRRVYPADTAAVRENLQAGPVRVFPEQRQVFVEGNPVDLTPAEFNILLALLKAGGNILSREQLLKQAAPAEQNANARIVDVHVAALRKKLGKSRTLIKTIHGKGYRFIL